MASNLSSRDLQQVLEAEYPLIDTSLLAALISDLPSTTASSDDSFKILRKTLSQLSLDAEAQQQQDESEARSPHTRRGNGVDNPDARESEHESTPDDLSLAGSATNTSVSSATSPTTSPFEFLRILFPHLSTAIIQKSLRERRALDGDLFHPVELAATDETDMSAVVDDLLTLEYIQDLTERGLEAISDMESDSEVWKMATARGKHTPNRPKPLKRSHAHTIPLVDVRQRQYIAREEAHSTPAPRSFSGDPWTRLASLATQLSDLLQPTPPGFFMSYFHAPTLREPIAKGGWKTEGDALRSALLDLVAQSPQSTQQTLEDSIGAVRDIVLHPDAEDALALNAEDMSRLEADIRLCVAAARGESAAALDVVWLLRELDRAFEEGNGIAHSLLSSITTETPSPSYASSAASVWTRTSDPSSSAVMKPPMITLPTQPPPVPPPPLSQKHPPSASSSKKGRGWTLVEPRRPALGRYAHPHADFIPAYSHQNGGARRPVRGSGNRFGKGRKGDVGELDRTAQWYRDKACDFQIQRNEALREASRFWQNGNAKTHGGEVALYYAEKARELQEQQKEWALEAARAMVLEKRSKRNERDTLDLHGLTVAEACVIVKEAIDTSPPSLSQPLKIITGRGRHSVGRVGVLGPAVKEMLHTEGFHVGKWDGGLVVRGKRGS